MNLNIVPFTLDIPLDLSSFKLDKSISDIETNIVFYYEDRYLTVGLQANIELVDGQTWIHPICKTYIRTINEIEPVGSSSIVQQPELNNASTDRELDTFANFYLVSLEDRVHYYQLDSSAAINYLLFKQNADADLYQKLSELNKNSSEYLSLKKYLDTLEQLPTKSIALKDSPINHLVEDIFKDHEELGNIKEQLSTIFYFDRITRPSSISPILLSGPPGVGKTTLAINIANSIGVPWQLYSLSSIHDNNSISGFNRTYTNSTYGLIIKAMIDSKCNNPVIIFDELDKTKVQDIFLNILDDIQNKYFIDSYINRYVDISNITFIFTCNDKSNISNPILDRLHIIEMKSYSPEQLEPIIINKLIPYLTKILKFNGPVNIDRKFINKLSKSKLGLRKIKALLKKIIIKSLIKTNHKEINIEGVLDEQTNSSSIGF